jgi:hypothetical protein
VVTARSRLLLIFTYFNFRFISIIKTVITVHFIVRFIFIVVYIIEQLLVTLRGIFSENVFDVCGNVSFFFLIVCIRGITSSIYFFKFGQYLNYEIIKKNRRLYYDG